ncbi:MAG TPA: hypothetical protein VMS12_12860 [Thermoanaerobaculia bacterium]|nr:hypothetical protein [Thermoanaerobaculia bacterium]
MHPEETPTRSVEPTPEGVRVVLRAPASAVYATLFTRLIAVGVGGYLLHAALASLPSWDAAGPLVTPYVLLELGEFSELTVRWILYAAILVFGYAVVAGVLKILAAVSRRDVILIQPGQWRLERRIFGVGRSRLIELHEKVALEFAAFDNALIARTPNRKVQITDLGTADDRRWLKTELDRKGTVSALQNIGVGGSRVIRTVRLERRSDGSLLVSNTKASRYGCPVIATILAMSFVAVAVLLRNEGWGIFAVFLVLVTLMLWLSASARKETEVSRGSIRIRAHSFFLRLIGKGSHSEETIRSSILYLSVTGTNAIQLRTVKHGSGFPVDVPLVSIIGTNGTEDAKTILHAISEASGFPALDSREAEQWKAGKLAALDP